MGININAATGVLSIPDEKLDKIKRLCVSWASKHRATRNQIQKLLGHLLYLHKCISPARLFTNHILAVLRRCPKVGYIPLNEAFKKDIAWFNQFLVTFNSSVKIHDDNVANNVIYVDASLLTMGDIFGRKVYTLQIPHILKTLYTIVQFEAVNNLVMLRTWGKYMKNKKCTVYCDNMAVVNAYTNHKIQNPFLMACVRSVWLIYAVNNIKLHINHIKGKENTYADILSRWQAYFYSNSPYVSILKQCDWYYPQPVNAVPNFQI